MSETSSGFPVGQETALFDQLKDHLADVNQDLKNKDTLFRTQLYKLVDEITNTKPATIFFLDRSARPVSWMLQSCWSELQHRNKIPAEIIFPNIRFLTIKSHVPPSQEAIEKAKDVYHFDRQKPVMVVDEYSETFDTLNQAAEVVKKLGISEVIPYSWLKYRQIGRPPAFWEGKKFKSILYGIEDTQITRSELLFEPDTSPSLLSQVVPQGTRYTQYNGEKSEELKIMSNQYRQMFINFGKAAGQQYGLSESPILRFGQEKLSQLRKRFKSNSSK